LYCLSAIAYQVQEGIVSYAPVMFQLTSLVETHLPELIPSIQCLHRLLAQLTPPPLTFPGAYPTKYESHCLRYARGETCRSNISFFRRFVRMMIRI
jgi:hypothetical protein